MIEAKKVVWVLGAGFSRPLGGPLLRDFFRPEIWAKLRAYYDPTTYPLLYGADCRVAHALYNYGIAFRNGKVPADRWIDANLRNSDGEHLWEDAEEFIAFLETAALKPDSGEAKRIADLVQRIANNQNPEKPDTQSLAGAAKRLVAAECSTFLVGADLKSETWLPYVDWARRLCRRTGEPLYESTIITFNYDLIPELLEEKIRTITVEDPSKETAPYNVAAVIKLHGSVNWSRADQPDGRTVTFAIEKADYAMTCDAKNLALAVPGPSKLEITGRLNEFWDRAVRALMKADAIVFVGYRFPATDAISRKRLLDAIRDNQQPYLAVHAVLGPNTGEPDTIRLQELLRMTLWHRQEWSLAAGNNPRDPPGRRAFNLRIRPCWSQDFLSAFNEKELFDPWLKN